jgi:hypothetical protein
MADSGAAKSWRALRRERPLNETRVTAYRRLMEAELELTEVHLRLGEGRPTLAEVLDAAEADEPSYGANGDIYLETLARYTAALGGHLEVVAVLPGESVTVLRAPASEPSAA